MDKGTEVPKYITRKWLQSCATNPDYPAELAKSIIAETKKENWCIGNMIGKATKIIDFLKNEENVRLESLRIELQRKQMEK